MTNMPVIAYEDTIVTFDDFMNFTPQLVLEASNKTEASHFENHVDIYVDNNLDRTCIKEQITQALRAITYHPLLQVHACYMFHFYFCSSILTPLPPI